jgi:hypothetical protein
MRVLADHEALARRRGDTEALRAVAEGRRRTGELYAHQAVDAARRELDGRRLGAGLRHARRAVAFSPRVTGLALGRATIRRFTGGR